MRKRLIMRVPSFLLFLIRRPPPKKRAKGVLLGYLEHETRNVRGKHIGLKVKEWLTRS